MRNVMLIVCAFLLGVSSLIGGLAFADGDYSFRIVAKVGDPAPGGGFYGPGLEPNDINDWGTVMFVTDLTTGGQGLFLNRRGVNSQIVRSGQPAPGTDFDFGFFGSLTPSGLNDVGDMAFGFSLDLPPLYDSGVTAGVWRYSGASGAATKVLAPGDPAPGGHTFQSADWHTYLNNRGEIATAGIIDTYDGNCTNEDASCYGFGRGVYKFDRRNKAIKIAAPGDPAPGGGVFDDAWDPNINDWGDVVFGGHVKGEACFGGSSSTIGCYESLYLYRARTGTLSSLVHQGDPAPGGDTFDFAFNGRLNSVGDVSFIGVLDMIDEDGWVLYKNGVFLYRHTGSIVKVAKPGDRLPGGVMANTNFAQGSHGINDFGDVAFVAQLDADVNHDGIQDTGIYLYHAGRISTVVRTGTVIRGFGKVAYTNNYWFVGSPWPWPGVHLNNRGEVLTQVTLEDGHSYVVVATPPGRWDGR